jgi:hypothetical protein
VLVSRIEAAQVIRAGVGKGAKTTRPLNFGIFRWGCQAVIRFHGWSEMIFDMLALVDDTEVLSPSSQGELDTTS